jgi:DNA-binding transcriptional LysR family regulator
MELRHLRYFVAVAEDLHFSRAAERLHISPPSLTQQIQNLEQELGARLFVRTKRNVKLTDPGARFLEEARATLRQAERAELVAKCAGRGEMGRVEIGFVSSAACAGLLTDAVPSYRQAFPLVELSIRKMETARQLEHLAESRLDVGFLRPPRRYPTGISAVTVARQFVVVALPKDHKLAAANKIPPASLAAESFIAPAFEADMGLYRLTDTLGQQGRFVPRVAERAPDVFTIVTLVAAGFGIAIVPQSIACIQIPGVIYRPLTQQANWDELVAAFRRDERTPAVKAFIQHLRKWSSQSPFASENRRARPSVAAKRADMRPARPRVLD